MASIARRAIGLVAGGAITFAVFETTRGEPKFYSQALMPTLHKIVPAETAHNLAVKFANYVPIKKYNEPDVLHTKVWDIEFSNPIGIAAGFDKHGEAMQGLKRMGAGYIEIGSVTPQPQLGNDKPRVFRLSEDKAVINRYGFNSVGHDKVAARLALWRNKDHCTILGVNLGKNKTTEDHKKDYVLGVKNLGKYADYIVINISSPNTPGLRKLQGENFLKDLLQDIKVAKNSQNFERDPKLLVKIAPDLTDEDVQDIANVVKDKAYGVDGLIISNTTISRPEQLTSEHKKESGGLSGAPLKDMSTSLIARMYSLTGGSMPIIGVGGISSGVDAYEKLKAGASLVQIYTALIYHGPPVLNKIKMELADLLEKDEYTCVSDAVGVDHKKWCHYERP